MKNTPVENSKMANLPSEYDMSKCLLHSLSYILDSVFLPLWICFLLCCVVCMISLLALMLLSYKTLKLKFVYCLWLYINNVTEQWTRDEIQVVPLMVNINIHWNRAVGSHLLTWINLKPSMKYLPPLQSVGWYYLSIPKLQQLYCWSFAEKICNFDLYFLEPVVTYPCCDKSPSMFIKGPLVIKTCYPCDNIIHSDIYEMSQVEWFFNSWIPYVQSWI